jgi:signal transduction histidine kinase/ActR/RegA family two-component response regulator
MGAQFDFANQELEISELKSETLQKEVEIARAQARQRTIALTFGVVLVLLGSGGGLVHYRSVIRSRNHIRRKNDELNQSNAFLEKALKAKSEFLATTSHEIRTPLNGILGTTQVLIHSSRMPPDVRERVELIQIAGEAMKGIVDDLLDVAKMESGSIELVEDRFDLGAALSDVARFWSDSAVRKGLNLEADLDACPGLVIGDERRLRQVVYNLLSNAVKFTDHGFVRLCARPDPDALDHLLVEVADTGCGIPEEELEKIFAPFHQVDGGKTRRHGGTGLGLSICQNLASALGGRVAVTSEVGEGSSFILRVPLKRAEAAPPVMSLAAGAGDVEQDQAQRLLVISDNAAASAALQIPMAMRDVEFDLVETLPEALETLNSRRFSGLLLVSSVLGEDPGDGMEKLMNLHEASHEACLAVWLAEESLLTAPMLRLSGASSVLEGKFDAETILDWVLNEEVSSTENQEMSFIGKAVSGA